MKRALDHPRQILDAIDSINAFAEGPVNLELIRVLMKVDLLMRMAPVIVRRHVPGDDDHRDRIERGVCDAGACVGEARTEMGQQHPGLAGRARVAIRGMRRHLLVARRDEADAAPAERVEERDVGVAAQAKNDLDAQSLEILGKQVR